MRRSALDPTTGRRDEALDGGRVEASGELLLLRLDSGDDGNGEELFVDAAVEVENLEDLRVGFGLGEEGGVALLPEELASAEKGFCGAMESARSPQSRRNDVRGFLNSQRTTEFHWFSLRGRSRCERIHCRTPVS